ncbi:nitroreductase family protein [Komagataeibacter intermedius]|uniref:DrgA n=2 Tax=Komagataeibacter intermedius TaxID=66229 RepID=A0A0N1N622_9PROT|nr:nitroreductase family protein [Komagataeibacter intermedius]KPH88890.1 drgA [Komagataeibacter intermedius AF2]MCF3634957.1 nitroreductase family protein [Komagataeibacter intermedius]GAN86309.1 NAD(P)H nitroreductase [Komagataeibacter intermedius TF2]GBQ66504.1 NADH/NADPH-flavin oxidoreductase [Komagataeibacter intermedius NRIC 0521]
MDTLEAIRTRRAIRAYDPTHEISPADLHELLSAARHAPSAFNIQHCRFVVVKDPALRRELRKVAWDQPDVTDASALIVICADRDAWKKDPARYFDGAPDDVKQRMADMIRGYYDGREWVQQDETMRSAGLAAQTLMLAATARGYQSCPMDGFDYDAVGRLINLPADHVVAMFVVIGKGTEQAPPRVGKLPDADVILTDRFPPA